MNSTILERYHSQDNYYSEGEGLENSQWKGKVAEIQGLQGSIQKEDWLNACNGIDPNGNAIRRQQRGSRAGWDITLSASKSVSLKALIDQDQNILEAHREAVNSTVHYIEENCIHAQITRNGQVISEQTQHGHFALFEHDDNRNQEPQLHTHVVILNQTLCSDGKSRTLDSRELFNQKKTIGAVYDHALAYHLQQQGYDLNWTSDHTFEIDGYEREQLEEFSSRRQEIRDYLKQQNIAIEQATEAQKTIACLESRAAKIHKLTPIDHELQHQAWTKLADKLGIHHPQPTQPLEDLYQSPSHPGSINEVINSALESATAYQVAIAKQHLFRDCLRYSQGFYEPEAIARAIDQNEQFIETNDQRLTTQKILKREQFILKSANSGQDSVPSLSSPVPLDEFLSDRNLNGGQANALKHLVTNQDQVVLIQGDAGVGKTYTLDSFRELLPLETRTKLIGLAPSAAAAQVLNDEAGLSSQTVDRYLFTPNDQLNRDQILIVDEAGMLSHQQMAQLLKKSQDLNHRLILVGDTKQLSSVLAGAPFRLLQERSNLPTINLNENLRQVTLQLKQAVDLAASQEMIPALQVLDQQGAVSEIRDEDERLKAIAQTYLNRPHERQVQTLVLCDTNRDRQSITDQIRASYIEEGKLGQEVLRIQTLQPKRLDDQAIAQAYNYEVGDVIRFRSSTPKFPSLYYRVTQVEGDCLNLKDRQGERVELPIHQYRQREVFRCRELELREGDRLRFTRNQRGWQQINGQLFTVEGFNSNGTIQINSRGKSYPVTVEQMTHADYAYCQTVYGAQGWTAKEAIWAPGQRPGQEQTYVALSRAKENLEIITLDRQALGLSIQQSQAQENALDLVQSAPSVQQDPPKPVQQESDAQFWQLFERVRDWKKVSQPQPQSAEVAQQLQQQVSALRQTFSAIDSNVQQQRKELEELGEPRSLFNWKGPSQAEVEARRQLIRENVQRSNQEKRKYNDVVQKLQHWQAKQQAFEEWERSPLTQVIREQIEYLKQPESLKRLERIEEGQRMFQTVRELLNHAGQREGKMRRIRGQTYFMETDGQSVFIMRNDKPIFHASDNRKQGGIVQTHWMEMTEGDKNLICRNVEGLKAQLRMYRNQGISL